MKTLFNFNQQTLKFALASTLAIGAVTTSCYSVATTVNSTVTVSATLAAACQVSPTATISFGSVANLFSNTTAVATSAGFQVACSSDAVPFIYTSAAHTMVGPSTAQLPFNLSLTSGAAADDFPTTADTAPPLVQDGTLKTVPLYASIPQSSFTGKPSGSYTLNLVVHLDY
jgi:spore coat protein U-like protein